MAKRAVIGIIFLSMTLHSASRLGVVSYFYNHRHEISFKLGLIAELPIAICSPAYEFSDEVVIHTADDSDETLPPFTTLAKEILLYVDIDSVFSCNPRITLISDRHSSRPADLSYNSPALSIFHPPS